MSGINRQQKLIEANIEDVWAVVGDPRTHPDWWPEVVEVTVPDELSEGGEYVRVVKQLGFREIVDNVWVAERLEHLKEAHYRCTASGSYARFALTPARDDTFVELETGMLPTTTAWRIFDSIGRPGFRRWSRDLFDALPAAIARRHAASR